MVSDLDNYFSKLDAVLERFAAETIMTSNPRHYDQSSQSETNVDSSGSVVILRNGEKLIIRDLIGPVATNGRSKSASKLKSDFEDSLLQKEVKQCKYENYQ